MAPTTQTRKYRKLNNKQSYLIHLVRRLDCDVLGAVETRQQYDLLPNMMKMERQLDLREGARCQTSHNVHERFGINQQGVTCLVVNEMMGGFVTEQGVDEEGLGRWSWIKFTGKTVITRIVVAYMPCSTRKQAVHATMAQHRRYWRLQGKKTCPRKLMRLALIGKLKEWRGLGEKLILLIDSNENMEGGPLARMLADPDLDMVDAVKVRSHSPGPPNFCKRKPSD